MKLQRECFVPPPQRPLPAPTLMPGPIVPPPSEWVDLLGVWASSLLLVAGVIWVAVSS